ncbi:hypothetical protein LT962_005165, partial [Escherichia coli]|nr:hypothetical protein [Escherichia coli]
MNKIYKVIWN